MNCSVALQELHVWFSLVPRIQYSHGYCCLYYSTEVFRLVVRKNLKSADACAQIPSVFRALWCQEHHQNQSLVRICSISALRMLYLVRCGPWSSQCMQKNQERSHMRKRITDNRPENFCTVSNGKLYAWGLGISLCVTIGCCAEKGFSGS